MDAVLKALEALIQGVVFAINTIGLWPFVIALITVAGFLGFDRLTKSVQARRANEDAVTLTLIQQRKDELAATVKERDAAAKERDDIAKERSGQWQMFNQKLDRVILLLESRAVIDNQILSYVQHLQSKES